MLDGQAGRPEYAQLRKRRNLQWTRLHHVRRTNDENLPFLSALIDSFTLLRVHTDNLRCCGTIIFGEQERIDQNLLSSIQPYIVFEARTVNSGNLNLTTMNKVKAVVPPFLTRMTFGNTQ